jgi:hypothetical protein
MASNLKGRIIIGTSAVIVVSVASYLIFSGIRKRRILKDIYDDLRDFKSAKGKQALLSEQNQVKGTWAFNPQFWEGKLEAKPNIALRDALTPKDAREIATNIYNAVGYFYDDESKLLAEVRKLKSQGQVSLVAYVFENAPLSYGSMSDYIISALTGWTDGEDLIKELNTYVNSLPL